MEYTKTHQFLKSIFSLETPLTKIEGSDMCIQICNFKSLNTETFISNDSTSYSDYDYLRVPDSKIAENFDFAYPVFLPSGEAKYDKAIVLMHGLNERTWHKYLTWAFYLCQKTNRPVILFPISFHMNRSPESWSNPRKMIDILKFRNQKQEFEIKASVANIALSERLTEHPLRFFNSGYQSAQDIITLIKQINIGEHPSFKTNTKVDFFAYSIGAYLSQVLMLANPLNLLNESRLFMFCGGAFFKDMDGRSKLIMDNRAFDKIYDYYLNGIQIEMKTESSLSRFLSINQLGKSFRAMLAPDNLKDFREGTFQKLNNRIHAITLLRDAVIPAKGIVSALSYKGSKNAKNIEVFDFPYDYTHETPFPVNNPSIIDLVDKSFERIFKPAAAFLV
jgi:hypothetical protein